jgi:hypothetical protein
MTALSARPTPLNLTRTNKPQSISFIASLVYNATAKGVKLMPKQETLPSCPQSERITVKNSITKSMMGSTRLGIILGARLIERSTGQKPNNETLEIAGLNAQIQTTDAIERAGKWAARQACELCPGPTNDPMSGKIYCGREVPDQVIINIARQD